MFYDATYCAVSSFEDWKSDNGFCYYGPRLTDHFQRLGTGTCKGQNKDCYSTDWCCPDLKCQRKGENGVCEGNYDERYIKRVQFPRKDCTFA